ncbi:adhesin [Spiroplasma endosymbiont of Nephrotoma flavescens]|uniref:adhesin n=1 Tax=Spiroplasma endosymbiont of Nephrotoma flavescens TaxID=3066302 RepID=UPI00313D8CD5
MKKILSLLSISILTTSIPVPLLANTTLERVKRATKNPSQCGESCNLVFSSLKNTKLIHHGDYWLDISESGFTWPSDIKLEYPNRFLLFGYKNWTSAFNFYKDNGTLHSFNTPGRGFKADIYTILEIVNVKITIGLVDKLHDSKHYITSFSAEMPPFPSLDWTKQQSQFNLVDTSKTKIWTRPDLVVVDGELNIVITNPNIDKVVFDNVLQGQTNKQWKINVKPETSEKDHHLQVFFTLNGKQYTSEITVSMLAKIEPTTTPIKKQLSALIKRPDLGNIIDNNDDTIFLAANKTNNNIIDDFTQLKIAKKIDTEATLIAKEDSKSYQGSIVVNYNVVPSTVVDSKIDLQSTTSDANVDSDYLAQLDKSNITSPVNTFYYASSESTITMIKPILSSVISGVVYGCDDKWEKNGQQDNIDITNGIKLDGSQLGAAQGKYLIELKNELGHTNNIYLQIAADKEIKQYWNTDNGKHFEQWAEDNGYKNIRGSSAGQLNNLFLLSKTWKQSLKHLKLQLDNFVVVDIKNVTQDEINTYKTKLLARIKTQVEKYVPDVAENTDYKILADNLVAGDWTTSKNVIVQAVKGSTKLLSFIVATIPIQAKDHIGQPGPNTGQTPASDNNDGDSKLWIIGVVVGVLAGFWTAYLLFKRFVFNKYILPKIYARRQQKVVEQWKRDDREEAEELAHKQTERQKKQNKQNDNNQEGDE